MDKHTYRTNVTILPMHKTHQHVLYHQLVNTLQNTPSRAIRLVIDCERYSIMKASTVDAILIEIHLWSQVLGGRTIESLYLLHPHLHLEPPDLTRVLYAIASKFKVAGGEEKKYKVVTHEKNIEKDYVALTKGLGFNAYQIIIATDQFETDRNALKNTVRLLKDFAIKSIGIQLQVNGCLSDIRSTIKEVASHCAPDYICLGDVRDPMDVVPLKQDTSAEELLSGNNDTIELGPEGVSKINKLTLQNYCSPDRFKASLSDRRIPVLIRDSV